MMSTSVAYRYPSAEAFCTLLREHKYRNEERLSDYFRRSKEGSSLKELIADDQLHNQDEHAYHFNDHRKL